VQDQLQEMVYNKDRPRFWNLASDFDLFIYQFEKEEREYTWSGEQLWLAFVMKEKFNKIRLRRETGPGGQLMDFGNDEGAVRFISIREAE